MSKKKKKKGKKFTGEVTKTRAVKIFEALNFKTASGWNVTRLQKKIQDLPDLIEGAKFTSKMQRRVDIIVRALGRGMKITVVDVEDATADAKRKREIEDAAKREAKRKSEKKAKDKSKAKAEDKKAAKKDTSKKQAKKAVTAEKKKSNKDLWGFRQGTFRAKVNTFLRETKKPVSLSQTIKQAKKVGASGKGPWGGYLDSLVEAGHLKKDKDGAYISTGK